MESGLSLALPKLCLEHITAEIQHMATVRKGEREIDRGREEKQKEPKKNRAGLTFGFSVSKTPPPSVACPHVSLLCLVRISCPYFMSCTLTFSVSYSSSPLVLSSEFFLFTWCVFSGCPPPTISFYSVSSLIKSLCEVSNAWLIWQAAHKPEHARTHNPADD